MSHIKQSVGNIYNKTSLLSKVIRNYHISAYAASMAFFMFLSLVPLLMLLCIIISHTPISEDTLSFFLDQFMPETLADEFISLFREVFKQSMSFLPVTFVVMIWSAAKGAVSLMYALNNINDTPENRPYLLTRTIASFYTLIFLLGIVLSLLFVVFGSSLKETLLTYIPILSGILKFLVNFRILLVWGVLTLAFSAIYAYVPANRKNFFVQLPGAFIAAVAWTAFSVLFSYFLSYTDTFGIYGSLSIIVILLIWLYACMNIILYCAYINIFIELFFKKRKERKNGV